MLAVGREEVGGKTADFAAGVELIVFDDHEEIDPSDSLVLTDNETLNNPLSGEPALMQKFPATGGFVPLGAKRPDGSDHPHAGTGFLVLIKHGVPPRALSGDVNGYDGSWVLDADILRQIEVHQLSFDGERITVTATDTFGFKELLPGHTIFNRGLGPAVADDDDLLLLMQGGDASLDDRRWATDVGSGCMRWTHGEDGRWLPRDYNDILGDISGYEASMVRKDDGSLLATARQTGRDIPEKFSHFLWQSVDNGRRWKLVFERNRARAETPITLGKAGDGTVFFAGNILTGAFVGDSALGYWREISAIWPVRDDCLNTENPLIHRCASFEWGPPPSDRGWNVDHLIPNQVHLADGKWHTLITYRGMDRAESSRGSQPTEHTGLYIDEVLSAGPVGLPPWNF